MKQSQNNNKKRSKKQQSFPKHLKQINFNAAGIDIGSRNHFVAVPEGRDEVSVKKFSTFTADLYRLAGWLTKCNVETVAMESTGVYWIPVFEILEDLGFDVILVNARHVKNVPGRKTDVIDCQWIMQLHTYGLLRGAVRPSEQICALRTYLRQREKLVRFASSCTLQMQKSLTQMNLLLHNVVNDITGLTGMKIIRSIVDG